MAVNQLFTPANPYLAAAMHDYCGNQEDEFLMTNNVSLSAYISSTCQTFFKHLGQISNHVEYILIN
jgi:hypothetical protein